MWSWSCPNATVGSQQCKLDWKRTATVYQKRYDQHSTPQNTPEIYAGSPQGEQPVPSSDWNTGCVSSAHWGESYPRKASFGSPQTGEPVFTRVPYSLAFSRILVCPSLLSFLQTCLFFSRLCVCVCVCVCEGWSRKCAKHVSYCAERVEWERH